MHIKKTVHIQMLPHQNENVSENLFSQYVHVERTSSPFLVCEHLNIQILTHQKKRLILRGFFPFFHLSDHKENKIKKRAQIENLFFKTERAQLVVIRRKKGSN